MLETSFGREAVTGGNYQQQEVSGKEIENITAERQEPEGEGENDELGFVVALLTMQYMDKIMPRTSFKFLHAVGFWSIVASCSPKSFLLPNICLL